MASTVLSSPRLHVILLFILCSERRRDVPGPSQSFRPNQEVMICGGNDANISTLKDILDLSCFSSGFQEPEWNRENHRLSKEGQLVSCPTSGYLDGLLVGGSSAAHKPLLLSYFRSNENLKKRWFLSFQVTLIQLFVQVCLIRLV